MGVFISFSCLLALDRASSTTTNKTEVTRVDILNLVPGLRRKAIKKEKKKKKKEKEGKQSVFH